MLEHDRHALGDRPAALSPPLAHPLILWPSAPFVKIASMSERIEVGVLIVGGGACGLASSVMLSDLGVASLLVERHPTTALLPKAHIINPRSMEILHLHGMAEEVCREGAPPENNASAQWYTSLGGDEPWHQQQVHRVDAEARVPLRRRRTTRRRSGTRASAATSPGTSSRSTGSTPGRAAR